MLLSYVCDYGARIQRSMGLWQPQSPSDASSVESFLKEASVRVQHGATVDYNVGKVWIPRV